MRKCDICNGSISGEESYFLTTKEVVTAEGYWRVVLPSFAQLWRQMGMKARVGEQLLHVVARIARLDTPWVVCLRCFGLFPLDPAERKSKAEEYLSTGKPAGGFALCRLEYKGTDIVVENIDDDAMMAALRAAAAADRAEGEA
ncbi:MAG: hypothetical protein A2Y61_07700 [Chloroflexi bacterium RBG_13_60_13]|nr:MAG: hypothetical protein A2Y61_07700 [Chloroflexi bacterium RBG_13_60_13]